VQDEFADYGFVVVSHSKVETEVTLSQYPDSNSSFGYSTIDRAADLDDRLHKQIYF
jgi:hypothetical protein